MPYGANFFIILIVFLIFGCYLPSLTVRTGVVGLRAVSNLYLIISLWIYAASGVRTGGCMAYGGRPSHS